MLSLTDLGIVPTSWTIAKTGDINGDGKTKIFWRNTNGGRWRSTEGEKLVDQT